MTDRRNRGWLAMGYWQSSLCPERGILEQRLEVDQLSEGGPDRSPCPAQAAKGPWNDSGAEPC